MVLVVLCEALVLEWEPPSDNGGAELVAYRVWLRPVFQECGGVLCSCVIHSS